jgi:hypothetical protein
MLGMVQFHDLARDRGFESSIVVYHDVVSYATLDQRSCSGQFLTHMRGLEGWLCREQRRLEQMLLSFQHAGQSHQRRILKTRKPW